jgi:NAD-dependent DNA ligase
LQDVFSFEELFEFDPGCVSSSKAPEYVVGAEDRGLFRFRSNTRERAVFVRGSTRGNGFVGEERHP